MSNFQLATDQFVAGRQDRAMQMEQVGAQALGGAIGNAPQQFMDARDQAIQAEAFLVERRQQAQLAELQMIAAVDERTAFKQQLDAQRIANKAAQFQLDIAQEQAAGERATREQFSFFNRPENRIIRDQEGKIVGIHEFRDGAFRQSRGEAAVARAQQIESQGVGLSPAQRETNRRFQVRNRLSTINTRIRELNTEIENGNQTPELLQERDALVEERDRLSSGGAPVPRQDDPLGDTTPAAPEKVTPAQREMVEEIQRISDHESMQQGGVIHQLNSIFGDAQAPAYSPRNARFWEVYGGMLEGFQESHGRHRGQSIVAAYLQAPGPWLDMFLNALGYGNDNIQTVYDQIFGEGWRDVYDQQVRRFGYPSTEPGRAAFEVK